MKTMTDIELINHIVDDGICNEIKLDNDVIVVRYKGKKPNKSMIENNEEVPSQDIVDLVTVTGRDFNISSNYMALTLKFPRLDKKK